MHLGPIPLLILLPANFNGTALLGIISTGSLHGEDKVKEIKWNRADPFDQKNKNVAVHFRTIQESLVGATETDSLIGHFQKYHNTLCLSLQNCYSVQYGKVHWSLNAI